MPLLQIIPVLFLAAASIGLAGLSFYIPAKTSIYYVNNSQSIRDGRVHATTSPRIVERKYSSNLEQELIGEATTWFGSSSKERKHNIALGAKFTDGIVIEPGAEFSMLDALGDITAERGFEKELVIAFGATRKSLGGGLCQVSTTMFRAALNAGLPIVERHPHGYVVSYYGPGLDASIYGPWVDMRYKNDTGYPIRVEGYADNSNITFKIYGIYDGRVSNVSSVDITERVHSPKPVYISDFSLDAGKVWCIEHPVDGMKTEVHYSVIGLDGEVKEQSFTSKYKPWGKKCYLGVKPVTQ